MARILVVDDEQSIREMLEIHLQREGFDVLCASNGLEALGLCRKESFDVVVADIKMPKMDGMSLLHKVKELEPQTVFIMVTAFASYETARESMQDDAYDYITKPFDVEEVTRKIEAALKQKAAIETTGAGSAAAAEKGQSRFGMIGICKAMHKVHDLIERSAASKSNILITGESGTGKELVARAVHDNSARSAQPFVTINCGGIPENLLESELFGYKKGAFTGAMRDKKGFLEIADSGTLFLDEVGELPLALQVKLLRMVQEKTFTAVGGTEEIVVDVRFISA
ncbi:MAG: sigma-54-dependent Fis family transcriptional regulator, partial [Deltaproteobacteria bacterium]|nr:sigma-54-dependent Fis family transcriptional regulator [Deltaproteobacteria bacterium]